MLLYPPCPANSTNFLGGKGKNLNTLSMRNIPVPEWFCISTVTYSKVITTIKTEIDTILDSIDYRSEKVIEDAFKKIKLLIKSIALPYDIELEIKHKLAKYSRGQLFAVRSSASLEDSARFSFAGQLDSFLYIKSEDITSSVKACWASAFNPRLLRYLHLNSIGVHEFNVAVIVQKMVNAEKSGVMFWVNPNGSINETVIVAGYGIGEGIVTDKVEIDTYFFDKVYKTVKREINTKESKIIFDKENGSGTIKVPVKKEYQNRETLTNEQLNNLISIGEEIDLIYGQYQDIEWAIDESGALYITQSRPISTIPQGEKTILDNSNIVEGYPGITKPLTYSFIQKAYEEIFRCGVLRLGISKEIVFDNNPIFQHMVSYVDGRVYYNLSNFYRMFRLIPGIGSYISLWEKMAGISEKDKSEASTVERTFFGKVIGSLKFYKRLVWYFLSLNYQMKRFKRNLTRAYNEFNDHDLKLLNNHDLSRLYEKLRTDIMSLWDITLLNDTYAVIFSGWSQSILKKDNFEDSENLFNELLCGEQDMESVEPVESALKLAEFVRKDNRLKEYLENLMSSSKSRDILCEMSEQTKERWSGFFEFFEYHLSKYGERSMEELKLESKNFKENPRQLLQIILKYASSTINIDDMKKRELEIRNRAEKRLGTRYRFKPVKGFFFNTILSFARRSIKYRENARLDRARAYNIVRNIFKTISNSFFREGALQSQDDIFYLTIDEIINFIYGSSANSSLKWLVEERKKIESQWKEKKAAERLIPQGTVYLNNLAHNIPDDSQSDIDIFENKNQIIGTGCSPGTVTAEAIVVTDPKKALDTRDKILVTEMTDPGWVFLMITAAGLIVEKGSLLSHTAIIGRELGVPTIVGVKGATQRIKSGMIISMNGKTGKVLLKQED